MNLTIIGVVVIALLAGGLGITGKMLLNAEQEKGELRVKVAERDAVIRQKEHDAELSAKLDALQQRIETALKVNTQKTTQAINDATTEDDAAAAAIAGVMRTRATGQRPGSP